MAPLGPSCDLCIYIPSLIQSAKSHRSTENTVTNQTPPLPPPFKGPADMGQSDEVMMRENTNVQGSRGSHPPHASSPLCPFQLCWSLTFPTYKMGLTGLFSGSTLDLEREKYVLKRKVVNRKAQAPQDQGGRRQSPVMITWCPTLCTDQVTQGQFSLYLPFSLKTMFLF